MKIAPLSTNENRNIVACILLFYKACVLSTLHCGYENRAQRSRQEHKVTAFPMYYLFCTSHIAWSVKVITASWRGLEFPPQRCMRWLGFQFPLADSIYDWRVIVRDLLADQSLRPVAIYYSAFWGFQYCPWCFLISYNFRSFYCICMKCFWLFLAFIWL